ncbi:MAG TPA: efflux transporter outer membrane subunit [Casimicrobiaceae bacterium]|nr:efflux transporter outer membrane subunit [Casimicrobiaceae bacterium]
MFDINPSGPRRLLRIASALAAVVALAACASLDHPPLVASQIDASSLGARAGVIDWPAEDWWRRYDDPQLDALIADGIKGAPTLAAARARIARADAAAGVARGALLPEISGNANSLYQRYSENYIFPPPLGGSWNSDNRLALDFNYEIDFWNKNRSALDAALSQAQAAVADEQAARLVLTTNIARAYFNLQRLFAQRDVSLAAIRQREDVVRLTAQRFEAGLDTKVEVKQADAALGTVRTELAQYDDAIGVARIQIAALVGAGPQRGDTLAASKGARAPASAVPAVVPLDLVGRRPEIVASRWRVEAAGHDVDVARAMFYPNVNLVAFVGLSSIGLSHLFGAASTIAGVGPAIHVPIFEGGRLNANLYGRAADSALAVSAYNQAVIDAVRDVAEALASIRGLDRVSAEQARAREATTDAYNLAVVRYRAGLGNYLTVLTAQTQQLVQDRLDADLRARAFELDVNLARALGGGYVDASNVNLSSASAVPAAR